MRNIIKTDNNGNRIFIDRYGRKMNINQRIGDIEIIDNERGLIMRGDQGTRYRIGITDHGAATSDPLS